MTPFDTKFWLSRYTDHKNHAARRRIQFLLTFEEWLKLWIDSGRMHERGTHKGGYVMARFGDKGPYAIGNVRIITQVENQAEYIPTPETRAKIGASKIGNDYMLGKTHKEETKQAIRAKLIGNTNGLGNKGSTGKIASKERREEISAQMLGNTHAKGYHHTEDAKLRIGKAARNRVVSEETRELLRIKSTNRQFSVESREKMAESARRAWERKKAAKGAESVF